MSENEPEYFEDDNLKDYKWDTPALSAIEETQ